MGYKIVVVGATGNVGREMLNILAEREFPVDEIAVLASRRSQGTEVSFGDRTLTCQDLDRSTSPAGTWRSSPSARRRPRPMRPGPPRRAAS
jgi:aspartate-semialdehyde dehydrogenase